MFEMAQESPTPEISGAVNLYSNILQYEYPKEWVPVYRAQKPGVFMLEYIPFGEDVRSNWTSMLTIQAIAKQRAQTIDPKNFALGFGPRMAATCPGGEIFEDLGEVEDEGGSAHRVLFGCRGVSAVGGGAGEATVLQAIKRNGDLIVVQYAVRGVPEENGEPLMNEAREAYFTSLLDRLKISDNPDG